MTIRDNIDDLNIFSEVQPILHTVEKLGVWIIIVCPNGDTALKYAQVVAGGLPSNARFSGRTGVFPNGGKVTVVSIEDSFIEGSYMVAHLGWGFKTQQIKGSSLWLTTTFKLFKAG